MIKNIIKIIVKWFKTKGTFHLEYIEQYNRGVKKITISKILRNLKKISAK